MTNVEKDRSREFLSQIHRLQDEAEELAHRYQCLATRLEQIGDSVREDIECEKRLRDETSKLERDIQRIFGYTKEED